MLEPELFVPGYKLELFAVRSDVDVVIMVSIKTVVSNGPKRQPIISEHFGEVIEVIRLKADPPNQRYH